MWRWRHLGEARKFLPQREYGYQVSDNLLQQRQEMNMAGIGECCRRPVGWVERRWPYSWRGCCESFPNLSPGRA